MAKRNQRSKVVPDTCNVCGKDKGILISAQTARFKTNIPHTTGPCDECKEKLSVLVDQLMAGGTLCVCANCRAVSVVNPVPEDFQKFVTQMPTGDSRLVIPKCPQCPKETTDEKEDETHST